MYVLYRLGSRSVIICQCCLCTSSKPLGTAHERNEQVNVLVYENRKRRWESYLEEHGAEFQSPSQLIRQAVESEVSTQSENVESPPDSLRDDSAILAAIDRLDERLRQVETSISVIEREVRSDPELRTVANQLFDALVQ